MAHMNTKMRTLIKCKDYLTLTKVKYRQTFISEYFKLDDEVIIFAYDESHVEITEFEDGFYIDVPNIGTTHMRKLKKWDETRLFFNIPRRWNVNKIMVVKHPFSNGYFTGTEFITYIVSKGCFITHCHPTAHSGRATVPSDGYGKSFIAFPMISDETEIIRYDDGVEIKSFCDEFLFVRWREKSRNRVALPKRWVGLDVLFVSAP